MEEIELLKNVRRGWLFCLNAPLEPDKGSQWGFLEDIYSDISRYADIRGETATVKSRTWGKPGSKDLRLKPGDGLAFFHGKKARLTSRDKKRKRHVKPYQISLLAVIDALTINENTRDVEDITFSFPVQILEEMRANPLTLANETVQEIVVGSGWGGGQVGTFFPIDPGPWKHLLEIANHKYEGISEKAESDDESELYEFVDQFELVDSEVRKQISETERFYRSPEVRHSVLKRAKGHCEWCGEAGFITQAGLVYLETHHIIPLSEGGEDSTLNVIGLCPKHHRESHYGIDSMKLRESMTEKVRSLAST